MSEQRTSILGRQIARKGNLPFAEPVLIAWSATLILALVLIFVIGQNIWVLGFDLALILAVIGATFEFGQRESYAASKAKQIRNRQRRKRGEHVYVSARDENFGDPDHDPGWEFPVPLYEAGGSGRHRTRRHVHPRAHHTGRQQLLLRDRGDARFGRRSTR